MSQINVNTITGKDGGSAVNFPNGITVTGVVTATTLNQNVTGNVTATSFTGPLTGNVTGNVTGNCSGTAGSLAAGATGADLTLSGDLTVNGTTTTIDTAVTAVDSLAVDGSITALGNCGIGTVTPTPSDSAYNGASLHLHNPGGSGNGSQVHLTNGTTGNAAGDGAHISMWSDNGLYITNQESAGFVNFGSGGYSNRMNISQHGMVKFGAPLAEKFHNDSNALTGDYNHDLITHGNVYWSVSNSSGPFTFNLRGSASVSLDSMMSDGESLSFLLTHSTNNASNYMTAFKVDGNTLINGTHIWWSGGTAPSAAGTSGYDVYSFTLYKIGGASFRAFASLTNHA
tara:strand:- start:1277 stop:2302 length:1026 start_codon:yes stop_codon:yes gene_type:complete